MVNTTEAVDSTKSSRLLAPKATHGVSPVSLARRGRMRTTGCSTRIIPWARRVVRVVITPFGAVGVEVVSAGSAMARAAMVVTEGVPSRAEVGPGVHKAAEMLTDLGAETHGPDRATSEVLSSSIHSSRWEEVRLQQRITAGRRTVRQKVTATIITPTPEPLSGRGHQRWGHRSPDLRRIANRRARGQHAVRVLPTNRRAHS
mmetsp:Transcript_2314/g.4679  ORF Transcript_2314/g.4679 Transcript_2314/m.4679 type:complete len:202 (-) Transcript_2314:423-1028(-)